MNVLKFSAITVAAMLLLASCKKDQEEPIVPSADYSAAADHALAMDFFNDMMLQVDAAASDNGLRGMDDECAPTVTFDTLAMPHTLTIDFGSTNCTAQNGRMRRGMLMVSFTGPYRAEGTVISITPEDYYVNDHLVQGVKTVTNMGLNADQNPYFNVEVDGTITAPDESWTSTHHSVRVRTWSEGSSTMDPFDDVYHITGSGNGVNRNGLPYTVSITNALRVAVGCPFITQGTLAITPSGLSQRIIDFGNGTCDGTITVSVNGYSFTITLG